ncbi:MAG: hypothetical protein ABL309_05820 [Phycisphaerales bacterium]
MTFTQTPRAATIAGTAVTLLGFGAFGLIAAIDPTRFDHLARKDNFANTGLIEHLTVAVLIPGIIAAIYTLIRFRRLLPTGWAQLWLLLWTLACIYFAGEECSWGQWYLEFETPEELTGLNDQGEFNLHNMSSWLDQKPRMLVEVFVIVAGFLMPLVLHFKRDSGEDQSDGFVGKHLPWTLAPAMCWAAAGVFFVQRIAKVADNAWLDRIGTSEFRELGVAWFLALYLLSYCLRLGRLAKAKPLAPQPAAE